MKLKWQWFVGGKIMFWLAIIALIILIFSIITTFIIDPVTIVYLKVEKNIDSTPIKVISEEYVNRLGIEINKPIVYRFVKFNEKALGIAQTGDEVLLGTFHEWNGSYYIDISSDLLYTKSLNNTVIHETKHLIVEYLKDKKIIDLTKYTENIAYEEDEYYDNLFESGVFLLKQR